MAEDDRYDAAEPCHATENGGCIVAELERLLSELRCAATDDLKRDALRYALHFVGNIHQPPHTVGTGRAATLRQWRSVLFGAGSSPDVIGRLLADRRRRHGSRSQYGPTAALRPYRSGSDYPSCTHPHADSVGAARLESSVNAAAAESTVVWIGLRFPYTSGGK